MSTYQSEYYLNAKANAGIKSGKLWVAKEAGNHPSILTQPRDFRYEGHTRMPKASNGVLDSTGADLRHTFVTSQHKSSRFASEHSRIRPE